MSTAAHGGIMVPADDITEYVPEWFMTLCGESSADDEYICFEEDEAAPMLEQYLEAFNKAELYRLYAEYAGYAPPINLQAKMNPAE